MVQIRVVLVRHLVAIQIHFEQVFTLETRKKDDPKKFDFLYIIE